MMTRPHSVTVSNNKLHKVKLGQHIKYTLYNNHMSANINHDYICLTSLYGAGEHKEVKFGQHMKYTLYNV